MDSNPHFSAVAWVRATTIGWFIGFFLMLALILVGELMPGVVQSMVGIGIGSGVGYWQSRLLRGILRSGWTWTFATGAGMGIPFVAWDIASLLGEASWFSLTSCVVAGGLIVGLWQWLLLRSHSNRAIVWVPASVAGWALPALAIAANDARLDDPWSKALGLAGIFLGGVMLGLTTGKPLSWILEDAKPL